jgi:hypothetical protein
MDMFKKLRKLIRIGASVEEQNSALEAAMVKRKIQIYARASFTRTGPGVRANLRRCLMEQLTPRQVMIAIRSGWEKGVLTDNDFRRLIKK